MIRYCLSILLTLLFFISWSQDSLKQETRLIEIVKGANLTDSLKKGLYIIFLQLRKEIRDITKTHAGIIEKKKLRNDAFEKALHQIKDQFGDDIYQAFRNMLYPPEDPIILMRRDGFRRRINRR